MASPKINITSGMLALGVESQGEDTLVVGHGLLVDSSGRLIVVSTGASGAFTVTPVSGAVFTIRGEVTTTGTVSGVTVTNSATAIKSSNSSRKFIVVTNNGAVNVFLGTNSSVTASGSAMGLLLAPGGTLSDDGRIFGTGDIYGIAAVQQSSQNIAVIERT